MKNINLHRINDNEYDFKYIKTANELKRIEYFAHQNIIIPFGETLFTIIEAIDVLNDIAILYSNEHINSSTKSVFKKQKLNEFFENRRYNLSELFMSFKTDIAEVKRLSRIYDFIKLCTEKPEYCNLNHLKCVAIGIFKTENNLHSLFKKYRSFEVRHLRTPIKYDLPFGLTTKELVNYLDKNYTEYSFSYQTKYHSLAELCIISLYEIFNLEMLICKCKMCGHLFIGNNKSKYCYRELEVNDYQGCKKYRIFLTTTKSNKHTYIGLFKRVHFRLSYRAKTKSKTNIELFEKFKQEWQFLKRDKSKTEMDYIEFLNDERWK